MVDYIPGNDMEFNLWQSNLVEITGSQLVEWGINADDFTEVVTAQGVWNDAYGSADIKKDRTNAEVRAKDDARAAYELELRKFYKQWLASNSRVSNKDRERMELTVKVETRTPSPKPTTAPIGSVDFATRLQHNIYFLDGATAGSKAKPAGVHGCEIWTKIDDPAPVDAKELVYLATATRSPYNTTFDGKVAGKTVYYWLRWVNTRGELGPWSRTVSATVAS